MSHGLSGQFLDDLSGGDLSWITERVRQDHTLNLEIRADRIHVYYRGGRLMNVWRVGQAYRSAFDLNYLTPGRALPISVPADARQREQWLAAIPLLKQEMDLWFGIVRECNEREFQQNLVRENNRSCGAGSTDYFCCSMEYQSPLGRFDVVAVHWPSTGACRRQSARLPLALVEIKYGDAAVGGECGLIEHLRDFAALARDRQRLHALCAEMTLVFRQRHLLGLITGTLHPVESISPDSLQVIFVLANTDPAATVLAKALDRIPADLLTPFPGGVWFARASQFSAGLFHDRHMTLVEFRDQLESQQERCRLWDARFRDRS